MQSGFVIQGGAELQAKLSALQHGAIKIVGHAVDVAQRDLRKQARANARALGSHARRKDKGMSLLLARHIVTARPRGRRVPGTYAVMVRMRSGVPEFVHVSKAGRRTFVPAAIEYGHGSSKEQAARPFMRPAADSTRQARQKIVADQIRIGLLREAIRARYR